MQRFVTSSVTGLNNVLIWMAMGMPTFMFGTIEIPFVYNRCNEAQTVQKPANKVWSHSKGTMNKII